MDMPVKRRTRAARTKARKPALGKDAWLKAARDSLIRHGIASVEIGKLARKLRATRGGFYWFFNSREELLDLLLQDWEETNTAAWKAILADSEHKGMSEFLAWVDMLVNEKNYSPRWDASIRDWARISPKAAAAVRANDDERIAILKQMFLDMGCEDNQAFVRARIAYFHQIGYYALGVRESREQRLKLMPLYIEFLTGRSP
jgi:AcrR family transcriptional regulator